MPLLLLIAAMLPFIKKQLWIHLIMHELLLITLPNIITFIMPILPLPAARAILAAEIMITWILQNQSNAYILIRFLLILQDRPLAPEPSPILPLRLVLHLLLKEISSLQLL